MRGLEPFYLDRKTGSSLLERSLKLSPTIWVRLEVSTVCGVELHCEWTLDGEFGISDNRNNAGVIQVGEGS